MPAHYLLDPASFAATLWQPYLPLTQIIACEVVLVALVVFAYWKQLRTRPISGAFLLGMRLAAIGALTYILCGPSQQLAELPARYRTRVHVLVDTSQSMQTADCGEEKPRIEYAAEKWLQGPISKLAASSDYDLSVMQFSTDVDYWSLYQAAAARAANATGEDTYLAECLQQAILLQGGVRDGAPELFLVLSDGRDSTGASIQGAARLAADRKIPIHAVGFGGMRDERDLAVLAFPQQDTLLPGEPGSILVKIYQVGLAGSTATLRLRSIAGETEQTVALDGGRVREIRLPIEHAEAGQYEYEVRVDPLPGEAETANNRQTVFCDVERQRIKVLVIEGQPFWDTKFIAQSLRKDERIELLQITQVSRRRRETIVTRAEEQPAELPKTPEAWDAFDVVIVGKSLENIFAWDGDVSALVGYVDRGGHLIFARGRAYDPSRPSGAALAKALEPIEPVKWSETRLKNGQLELTPLGKANPWLEVAHGSATVEHALRRLPGFESALGVVTEKLGTQVMMTGTYANATQPKPSPAVVSMPYGRGMVVGILGEGHWRWSLVADDAPELVGFYDMLWSNLVRWLAMGGSFQPGQQVSLQLSRSSLRRGDELVVDVLCKIPPADGRQPQLTLVDPAGREVEVALVAQPSRSPHYRATIAPSVVGIYEVRLATPSMIPEVQSRKLSVCDVNVERLESSADHMSLRAVADLSGGEFYGMDEADRFALHLAEQQEAQKVPGRVEYTWDRWYWMVLLLGWMGSEWIFRRFADLP